MNFEKAALGWAENRHTVIMAAIVAALAVWFPVKVFGGKVKAVVFTALLAYADGMAAANMAMYGKR